LIYTAAFTALAQTGTAFASEAVQYGPAPAWVVRAAPPDLSKQGADAPVLALFDNQQRIDGDTLTVFMDAATRAATPDMISQMANLSLPWLPDKGDLTIHELSIQRGAERIDLLAKGQKFTVLRREEAMEQRALTGQLTATLPVEGLQTGDILRLAYSVSMKDGALGGHIQNVVPVLADPLRIGAGGMRVSWGKGQEPHWKLLSGNGTPKLVKKGDGGELVLALPAAKPADMPADAPVRFKPLPLLELSSFDSWAQVSQIMAPLYKPDGLIPAGSPLAAEVAAIMKAEPTPIGRAQRALRLVQDQVRYLAMFMNGGNYVPQTPAKTWELRYGDCKAKSLLLLALLHEMGIEAEPVLANSRLGDWVPQRLPSAAAFDHVLIKATIDGRTAWMDGTRTGSRIGDFWDTPAFRNVLPLRAAGATLMPVVLHNDARPMFDIAIDEDQSATVDLPSAATIVATFRGDIAGKFATAGQLDAEQRLEGAQKILAGFLSDAQLSDVGFSYDDAAGTGTVRARAVIGSSWQMVDRRLRTDAPKLLGTVEFAPDRARPAWAAIPVAVDGPASVHWRHTIRLPDGGRGFALDGEGDAKMHVAGRDLVRTISLTGGVLTVDERLDETGEEVAAADLARERDQLASIKARSPKVTAPQNAVRYWDIAGRDPAGATQIKAVQDLYTRIIAENPEKAAAYSNRASYRRWIGDRAGAVADYAKAIALEPTAELHLARAWQYDALGNSAAALADAEAARKIDPASVDANQAVANFRAQRGDLGGALALLSEREAVGGEARTQYRRARADVLGEYGDANEALKLLDTAIQEKPGSPSLLNARCWLKGTRSVSIDTAIKDCTSAIELADSSVQAMDSRALVWFRLGRYDDALRDLDAVLAQEPGMAASRYLRAVVLGKLARPTEGARDLALARRIYPSIDTRYARYGLKP
jgi:tetratricopeptide (TPR) repeat protein